MISGLAPLFKKMGILIPTFSVHHPLPALAQASSPSARADPLEKRFGKAKPGGWSLRPFLPSLDK
jgi:hypothetical protein